MKIRTDFVTNSSSESSVEVFIDNPVLLEILQKYKDLGLFIEDGERAYDFGIGYAFSWYAGYYFEDGVSGSLDAVLGSINKYKRFARKKNVKFSGAECR